MPTTPSLTTSTQIQNRLSAIGLALRVDHAPVGATAEAISAASEDVAFYLYRRYPELSALVGNGWVSSKTTVIAIWYACGFRNNPIPDGVQAAYEKALEDLTAVMVGKADIPNVSLGKSIPQVVTHRINYGMSPSKRVVHGSSTGTANGFSEFSDPLEPMPR